FLAETRTSPSVDATLKDFVLGSVRIDSCPDVTVTKAASAPVVNAGDTYTYTITATNTGPTVATNVTVPDDLDDRLQILSAPHAADPSPPGGTGTIPPGPGNTLRLDLPSLAADDGVAGTGPDTVVITVTVLAPPAAAGTVTNTARVSASNEPADDHGNNSASATVTM